MDGKASKHREISDGPLRVRVTRDEERDVVALRGELDMANVATVRRELDAALNRRGASIIVDMRELEFIDSAGVAALVTALNRGLDRLRFVPSESFGVRRVLAMTGVSRWMTPAEVGVATRTRRRDLGARREGPSESTVLKALRRTDGYRRQREASDLVA